MYSVYNVSFVTSKKRLRCLVNSLTLTPSPFPNIPNLLCSICSLTDNWVNCFFNFIKVLDWMFTYHFRANLWNVSIARPIYTIFKKNSEDRTYFVGPKIFIKDKWHWRRNNILYIYAVYIKSMYLYQAKQRQKLCELINASFPTNLHLFYILN